MCISCAALSPTSASAGTDLHLTSTPQASYTIDQIANQLINGYWSWAGGRGWRAFDVSPGDTLTYDDSGLNSTERYILRSALTAWTDVSGIRFARVQAPTVTVVSEPGDAGEDRATAATMVVGNAFRGELEVTADTDWVKVRLVAGTTYSIKLESRGSSSLDDPYLELFGATGTIPLAENDDDGGLNSALIFSPSTTGDYYLVARSADGVSTGAYTMTVTEAPASPDLVFVHDDPLGGAFSTSVIAGNTIVSSYVSIDSTWDTHSLNSYFFQTYMHEIGHALGLGHAGNYNGDATWGTDTLYDNDSWQASVMSYFSQQENPNIDADFAYLATVMPADIVAIQALYGTNVTTRPGNNVYGAGSGMKGYLGTLIAQMLGDQPAEPLVYMGNPVALTIFDTGGIDTLNFSTVTVAQTINLTALAPSSVAGLRGNLLIARGVVIENAVGGSARDDLLGNVVGNRLDGRLGNDNLLGYGGNDVLLGGGGHDTLAGGIGDDRLVGGGGRDNLVFDGGSDRITYFQDNIDQILFSRALWGGAERSAEDILSSAAQVDGDLRFDFGGGNVLVVAGLASAAVLVDDILTY